LATVKSVNICGRDTKKVKSAAINFKGMIMMSVKAGRRDQQLHKGFKAWWEPGISWVSQSAKGERRD
jgi:hypothetical protein